MNTIHNIFRVLPFVAALILNGCGDAFTVAEGGIGGTGISTGTVTGIGSIKVNGVTFNTDNAAIYIEGVRVDDPDLADGTGPFLLGEGFSEGQVVRVVGTFNADGRTGTADAVYYNDSVEGPVESVTPVDAPTQAAATVLRLVVMGQTVIVDSQTFLDGTTLSNIGSAGHDQVEVSGLRDATGQIRAGYIRNTDTSDPDGSLLDEIKGVIDSINLPSTEFTINSLTIDYSNLPAFTPQVNMQVEVKGDYVGGQLVATSIELDDDIDGLDDDEVEYEGIVKTAPVPFFEGDSFVMGVQVVQTNSITVYKGGLVEDIVAGVRLEVEGYLQGGILLADEVRFRDAIEIDAPVVSHTPDPVVTPDTITITLNLGPDTLDVLVNNLSKLTGDAEGFTLTQLDAMLSNDDNVEVRGRLLNAGLVFAEEIKVVDGSSSLDVKLQGPVENDPVVDPLVTILGIDIDVDLHGISEFEGADDLPISRTDFFNTVVTGNIVSAEGTIVGAGVIDWDKLELEDEE